MSESTTGISIYAFVLYKYILGLFLGLFHSSNEVKISYQILILDEAKYR